MGRHFGALFRERSELAPFFDLQHVIFDTAGETTGIPLSVPTKRTPLNDEMSKSTGRRWR